ILYNIRHSKQNFPSTMLDHHGHPQTYATLPAWCTCRLVRTGSPHEIHSLRTSEPSGCLTNLYWCNTSLFPRTRRPAAPPLPRLFSPWSLVLTSGMAILLASELRSSSKSMEVRSVWPCAFPLFPFTLAFAFGAARRWSRRAGTVAGIGCGGFTVPVHGLGCSRGSGAGMGSGGVAGRGGLRGRNVR
ncbi:hypothetical protein JB92DRAFT_2935477, partial [Gautieria morchelliformis]